MLPTLLKLMLILGQLPFPGPGRAPFGGGGPALSYVSANCPLTTSCVANASAAAASVTPTTLVAGDLLVVTSKTQSASNTATVAFSGTPCTFTGVLTIWHTTSNFSTGVAWCIVTTGGSNAITATWTGGDGAFTDIAVGAYHTTNTWNSSAVDQSQSNIETGSPTACTTGTTAATTNANDIVVAISQNFHNAEDPWGAATPSTYTNRANSSRNTTGWYDLAVTSTGAQTVSIPFPSGDSCIGMIVAFKSN